MPRTQPIRVLVVDDSALMRKLLTSLLADDDRIEVVGIARDGMEAVRQTQALKPEVVTLDVEMPGCSGLDAIPLMLQAHEAAIIMISAFTKEGAEVTLEAMERGAVDFMAKPDRNQLAEMRGLRELLISKVITAASSRVKAAKRSALARAVSEGKAASTLLIEPSYGRDINAACVAIGISTGGPQTLTRLIQNLAPPTPPILVVQHMPAPFTGVLAERLNRLGALSVREASDGDRVLPDQVLIAPGARHLTVAGRATQARASLNDDPPVSGHRPSVDVLFRSIARMYGARAVGIIMTGMGRDGVDGCRAVLEAGGFTIGQDEASSIVYGMNKAAFEEGVVKVQASPTQIARSIREMGEARRL